MVLVHQPPEHCDVCGSAHVDLSIDDHRRSKVASGAKLIPLISRLVRVVKLVRQIAGIVGMQDVVGVTVFDGPDDAVARAIRGYTWRGTRVSKRGCAS